MAEAGEAVREEGGPLGETSVVVVTDEADGEVGEPTAGQLWLHLEGVLLFPTTDLSAGLNFF